MARLHMTNNLLPITHPGRSAVVDSDTHAFAHIVSRLAGSGLSVQHTAAAMGLSRELLEMGVGTRREFKKEGLFDLVIIRLPDSY